MLAVDSDVGDAQIVILVGVARINRVELGRGVVGRAWSLIALVGLIGRGGGDERQSAALQRLAQSGEGHLGVVGPFVGGAIAKRKVVVADPLPVGDRFIMRGGKAEVFFAL